MKVNLKRNLLRIVLGLLPAIGACKPAKSSEDLKAKMLELNSQGKYDQAIEVGRQVIELDKARLGGDHPDVAKTYYNIGELYLVQKKYVEASTHFRRALRIYENAGGIIEEKARQQGLSRVLARLALAYQEQKLYKAAMPLLNRALEIDRSVFGSKSANVAASLSNLAMLYEAQGKHDQAKMLVRQAIAIDTEVLGEKSPRLATSYSQLGTILRKEGKIDEAISALDKAAKIRIAAFGPNHPDVAINIHNLATLQYTRKHYEEAEQLFNLAIRILERLSGPNSPEVEKVLESLFMVHQATGDMAKAKAVATRIQEIRNILAGNAPAERPATAPAQTQP